MTIVLRVNVGLEVSNHESRSCLNLLCQKGGSRLDLEEYLRINNMTLSTFAKRHQLNYHRLFRVKQGAVTRDQAIKRVFKELNLTNDKKLCEGEPNATFLAQERVCINCEDAGDIYCYYLHHLKELEAYLKQQNIPYYVRVMKDYWIVKYDKKG